GGWRQPQTRGGVVGRKNRGTCAPADGHGVVEALVALDELLHGSASSAADAERGHRLLELGGTVDPGGSRGARRVARLEDQREPHPGGGAPDLVGGARSERPRAGDARLPPGALYPGLVAPRERG